MSNVRMLPSPSAVHVVSRDNSRSYTPTLGAVVNVPDQDVEILWGNGWFPVALSGQRGGAWPALAGATSARPTQYGVAQPILPGTNYLDTTVGTVIVWDGATWRDPITGNAV